MRSGASGRLEGVLQLLERRGPRGEVRRSAQPVLLQHLLRVAPSKRRKFRLLAALSLA